MNELENKLHEVVNDLPIPWYLKSLVVFLLAFGIKMAVEIAQKEVINAFTVASAQSELNAANTPTVEQLSFATNSQESDEKV